MKATRLGRASLLLATALLLGAGANPTILRDVAYSDAAGPTLDLYVPVPRGADGKAPLLIFVHSRFWSQQQSERYVDTQFARPLLAEGVAVAVVRHRLAPEHRHPDHAQDVASAVAWLDEHAAQYGYDRDRIYLGGHSSGAHLAALVALDPGYLAAHGLRPDGLAGVIAISGVYNLDPALEPSPEEQAFYKSAFGGSKARRDASPMFHVHAEAPRFLLISAQQDIPGYFDAASDFADALRGAGAKESEFYFILGRDHQTVLDLSIEGGSAMHILNFMGVRPLPPILADLDEAHRYWRNPRFSTEPFWDSGVRVKVRDVDSRFRKAATSIFLGLDHKKQTFDMERYHAVDLGKFLEAQDPKRVGSGPWLTITNVQQEKIYFELKRLLKYRPVIVVGIDDERNLFRHIDIHRAKREYSWRDDLPPPPYLARPMGGFLYFLDEPKEKLMAKIPSHFSLDVSSFVLSQEDPLASLRGIDSDVFSVMTIENGCLNCHSFKGVGTRSSHLRARDGALQGGFALALEEYPPEVWKRFVFEQEESAAVIGATPNVVRVDAATKLYEAVERAR
ncbi:MAG: alpha/beta hydrolase [Myxococcales bacterium]|nr:alpha/beta hydrolase [Myxococcales bacterium]